MNHDLTFDEAIARLPLARQTAIFEEFSKYPELFAYLETQYYRKQKAFRERDSKLLWVILADQKQRLDYLRNQLEKELHEKS